ncbi:MAG: GGDEF domain-containing protein, partial [Candidatus Gracilibacteria bacterium]|nr:GGDEF domain-containing protein [Candidatus Gracilibacteria bacterium]
MFSTFKLRNISNILQKEFLIQDKNERKAFIKLFISMISDNVQDVLDKDNNFENIILKEGSNFRKLITKIIGLSGELIDSLDKFLKKDDFFESENLFSSLRDFIVSNYGNTIDLIVYKHNFDKNNLEYFAGNQKLDNFVGNQQLGMFDIPGLKKYGYKNELKSLSDDYPYSKFRNTIGGGLFCKKIAINFKSGDNIKKEEYILSFHANPNISDFNENNIDINIRRLIKLFQKNSLSNLLETKLSLINVKYKDSLTGAFNKDYATEVFKRKKGYSIIFIDVDNFKNINETYGHYFGDKVLKEITRILNLSIRPEDKVCRNGGDEFVILASTENTESVLKSIEDRIHENMKMGHFVCELGCDKKGKCDKIGLGECISTKFQNISVSTG